MSLPNKKQVEAFIRNELRDKAQERGLDRIPEQAQFNMADVAKVNIKNATSRRP